MKKNILVTILFFAVTVFADHGAIPTNEFVIKGKVKSEIKITLDDLKNYPEKIVGDIILTNQRGEVKDTIKNLKGVLLKDVLKNAELLADRPKLLNEFYFTCIASDHYKAVFSWNEIFNTDIGNNIFIITEKDGAKGKEIKNRIVILSKNDLIKGRRYIENLAEIIVSRVE